jgi:hypothetical protein
MESNTNNVTFQKQAPVSFNQSLNMFLKILRLLGYLKCSICMRTKIHLQPSTLCKSLSKWKFTKSEDPSAVFVNENTLNIEQSRFVKPIN